MRGVYLLLFTTLLLGYIIQGGQSTCVLESDFGFIINCAFKKSGLFRIRNLGGVKAHIGWGISLGDELGFKESISNTEMNRRRSAEVSKMQAQLIQATQKQQEQKKAKFVDTDKVLTLQESTSKHQIVPAQAVGTIRNPGESSPAAIPPFKPIPPAAERPFVPKVAIDSQTSKVVIAVPKTKTPKDKISDRIVSTNSDEENLLLPQQQQQQNSNTLKHFLSSNNITQEALEMALLQRQQISSKKIVTTTTTTTTLRPVTSKHKNSIGKVMNAPKEYYPVGYDKNFDDNFAARVDLPETSFYCGDQKHFPGLYADEDLGCMVFHVCALTDDGLIMKSFLCPESTLFDQAILKCNWWFYVDCKNSKKLYDSNIPISKSYQLMKALTFFSAYKKDSPVNGTKQDLIEDKN